MNITTIFMGIIILIGAIVAFNISLTSLQLRKESREFLRMLTAPKAPVAVPPPMYLPYEKCMPLFTKLVITVFQRGYINHIIPSISNADGKVTMLSPNDIVYQDFLKSSVIQVFESMPAYLQQSIFYYYNVKNKDDSEDAGAATLIQNITTQITSLLNNHIIKNAELIENVGASSEPFLKSVQKMANLVSDRQSKMKSPDGSKMEVIDY